MSIEGTLDEFRVPDILQMVAQQGKTGILTVQGDSTIIAVSFLSGGVVAADSLEETVEERLGDVLVREGMLSSAEFAEVVAEQREGRGRLIDLLVEGGHLDRREVLESLRVQTRELLENLIGWRSGDFKFYANDEVAYEEGFRPIVVGDLLISLLPEEAEAAAGWEDEVGDDTLGESFADTGFGDSGRGDSGLGDVGSGYAEPAAAPAGGRAEGAGELRGLDELSLDESFADTPPAAGAGSSEPAGFTDPSFSDEMAQVVPLPVTPARTPAPAEPAEGAELVPPEPEAERPAAAPPVAARRPARPEVPALQSFLPPLLAGLLALGVVVSLALLPAHVLLPLPWQDGEREDFQAAQRHAEYRAVDGAAKTFFLVFGRFPENLERLVDASLLHRRALDDPTGRPLVMEAREESYMLSPRPVAGEEPDPATTAIEAITGNFLLDPEYLSAEPVDTVPPLVLLD